MKFFKIAGQDYRLSDISFVGGIRNMENSQGYHFVCGGKQYTSSGAAYGVEQERAKLMTALNQSDEPDVRLEPPIMHHTC